ncbi:energy coupling factor transporter S component ThiW [Staphylococcus massiliensis]|uniref:Energy coupling factor transporter S component ThiW n=1 Tax=Staphylococcus massiliensis S46 TaxID=1229783 RepID=K9AT93_9STAP|nr:energy coupling factor transporter S component ThiW [Staphylococcus massiliensis]EKU50514.1 hypothetical protein C273_00795 [Staphylococcus massiliensis S46]MCG3398715.1 energy coupling factor transporter S component ThiW [Staphylococcus massiliensis]MCG3401276.1 energy coupling factor transporter S component ThiW [Staphylococcus massiliensis]MCG3412547.1 energy coupling factor transporter S component ThiW [Staphylococcus massiliensis]POA00384.1 energy coupling factor transporter S componen
MRTNKLVLTALFVALNVVLSTLITIPLGPIKAAPMQHFINVLSAVFLGPWFGLAQAFLSSVIRMIFGIGSPFAFPGSMIGVFLASILYMYRKHIFVAAIGEVIGTGIIGSLVCIPLAMVLNIQNFMIRPLMMTFMVSSFVGAIISYVLLMVLKKRGLIDKFSHKYKR